MVEDGACSGSCSGADCDLPVADSERGILPSTGITFRRAFECLCRVRDIKIRSPVNMERCGGATPQRFKRDGEVRSRLLEFWDPRIPANRHSAERAPAREADQGFWNPIVRMLRFTAVLGSPNPFAEGEFGLIRDFGNRLQISQNSGSMFRFTTERMKWTYPLRLTATGRTAISYTQR